MATRFKPILAQTRFLDYPYSVGSTGAPNTTGPTIICAT